MIHITENINYTLLHSTGKSITLKTTDCPKCGQKIRYYFESSLKCDLCHKSLPPYDILLGEKGIGHDMQRIAYHKGLKD